MIRQIHVDCFCEISIVPLLRTVTCGESESQHAYSCDALLSLVTVACKNIAAALSGLDISRRGHFDEQLVRFSVGDRAHCEIKHNFPFSSGVSFPHGHIVHTLRAGLPIWSEQSELHNA